MKQISASTRLQLAAVMLVGACCAGRLWAAAPDLVPAQPAGWSNAIVISTLANSFTDPTNTPPYSTVDNLYVHFGMLNIGDADAGPFQVFLVVDNVVRKVVQFNGLTRSATPAVSVNNYIGQLSRGSHTIQVYIDPNSQQFPAGSPALMGTTPVTPAPVGVNGQVLESNETNNTALRSFYVKLPFPDITGSAASAQAICGQPFTYQINASYATSYATSGLPWWLQVDTNTGLISGNPLASLYGPQSGQVPITIYASNADFSASMDVQVTIVPVRPSITSPLSAVAYLGRPFSYALTYTGSQSNTSAAPTDAANLIWSGTSQTITGNPSQEGVLHFTLNAGNDGGADQKVLTITVYGPPVFNTPAFYQANAQPGLDSFDQTLTAMGSPQFFFEGGNPLPQGLVLESATGKITRGPGNSPPPLIPGTYPVDFSAVNDFGSGMTSMIIGIRDGDKPAILSPLKVAAQTTIPFYYKIETTEDKIAAEHLYYEIGNGLPTGLKARAIQNNLEYQIASKQMDVTGLATLTVVGTHLLARHDLIRIKMDTVNVGANDPDFDGVYRLVNVPDNKTIQYQAVAPGAAIPLTSVPAAAKATIFIEPVLTGEIYGTPALTAASGTVTLSAFYYKLNPDLTETEERVTQTLEFHVEQSTPAITNSLFLQTQWGIPIPTFTVTATGGPTWFYFTPDPFDLPSYYPTNGTIDGILDNDPIPYLQDNIGTYLSQNPVTGEINGNPSPLNFHTGGPFYDIWYALISADTQLGPTPGDFWDPVNKRWAQLLVIPVSAPGSAPVNCDSRVAYVNQQFTYNIICAAGGAYSATLPWDGAGPNPPCTGVIGPTNDYPLQPNINLVCDPQTGVISGIPPVGAVGTWYLRLTASGGTSFGMLKLTILPQTNGAAVLNSVNADIGKLDAQYSFELDTYPLNSSITIAASSDPQVVNTDQTLPAYLKLVQHKSTFFLEGKVPASYANAEGVVGPIDVQIQVGGPTGAIFHVTLVFYDQAPSKPQVTQPLLTFGTELMPFDKWITATNNASAISSVTFNPDNGATKFLPAGLSLGATAYSRAELTGLPNFGTAFVDPVTGLAMARPYSVIWRSDPTGGGPPGFGMTKITINPAPPALLPSQTITNDFSAIGTPWNELVTAKQYGLNFTQTVGINAVQIFNALTLQNALTQPGQPPTPPAPFMANAGNFFMASPLPDGMSMEFPDAMINNVVGTGRIAGMPTTVQTVDLRVSAFNGYGSDTRTAQCGIIPVEINSPLTGSAVVGMTYSYKITATAGNVFTYDAANLPAGLTIDKDAGLITGVPLVASDTNNPVDAFVQYPIQLHATNAWNTGTATLYLRVSQIPGAPVIPPATFTGMENVPFLQIITPTPADPNMTYGVVQGTLPTGLTFAKDPVTGFGKLSGVPRTYGTYDILITATNNFGTGGQMIHLNIAPQPITFANANPPSGVVNYAYPVAGQFKVGANGSNPIKFDLTLTTGLPPGLTMQADGSVIGTPSTAGSYHITFHADNPAGGADGVFDINVYELPSFALPTDTVGPIVVGTPFPPYLVAAAGSPEQMTINLKNPLPPGLLFTTSNPPINPASGAPYPANTILAQPYPLNPGTTTVTITASNLASQILANANNAPTPPQMTLTIIISSMQITNNPLLITGVMGNPITPFQIIATGNPVTYGYLPTTPMPMGLTLDASGTISGIPVLPGTSQVTVFADNTYTGTLPSHGASADVVIAISSSPAAPAITSALTATATVNQPFVYVITATNAPPATWRFTPQDLSVNKWLGISLDSAGNGLLQGTPPPGAAGTYAITLSATNAVGTGSATLILGVAENNRAPAIVSPITALAMEGVSFIYQIVARPNGTQYDATVNGNPIASLGLVVDTLSGIITGAPLAGTARPAPYPIVLHAHNPFGDAYANMALTVLPPSAPQITSGGTASGFVGVPFYYVITTLGFTTTFGVEDPTKLPPGLSVNSTTGVINGLPLLAGVYQVTVTAANRYGTAKLPVTITISPVPGAPVITSSTVVYGFVGSPLGYLITATNGPLTSFGAVGLPPGMSIITTSGAITGTPQPPENVSYTAIVEASNAIGMGTAQVTFVIAAEYPIITSATDVSGNVGIPFTYQITATGRQPITFAFSQLPPGLSLSGNTVSGTPATQGVFVVTLTSSNAIGQTTTKFTFTIGPPIPPVITSGLTLTGMVGLPLSYLTTATGSVPMSFSAANLPPGMNSAGPSISGTPTAAGSYAVTLTASNAAASDTEILVINVLALVSGIDTDGDGFPDDLEIFLGTNPLDPSSTPFRGVAANPDPFHLASPKLALKMDFKKLGNDTLTLTGSLPIPPNFAAPGQLMVVDIAGLMAKSILDQRGSYTSATKDVQFKVSAPKAKITGVNGKYTIKMKGNFRDTLGSKGFTSTNAGQMTVPVIVLLGDNAYQKDVIVTYSVKNGKGTAK
ncbi:MAG TPA: putative Ig domain-containing protein [Planctomycetota bacterium]|jgi:PKD repeat protein